MSLVHPDFENLSINFEKDEKGTIISVIDQNGLSYWIEPAIPKELQKDIVIDWSTMTYKCNSVESGSKWGGRLTKVKTEDKALKDSGERSEFETGAVRDTNTSKGRFDLLPAYVITRLAKHYEKGAKKYAARNWEKGIPLQRYMDSALRHLFNHQDGQRDEDHMAAALWNIAGYIETEERIRRGVLPRTLDDCQPATNLHSNPEKPA